MEWDQMSDITSNTTIITNIYIFLDTMWPYRHVVDYINYILERLNIHPYASSVTLMASSDGSIIVNTTNYLNDIYTNWNISTHSQFTPGFNLPRILNTLRVHVTTLMNAERNTSTVGGQSFIALLVPSPIAYVEEKDWLYSKHYLNYLNTSLPDVNYLYFAGGALIRLKNFVGDPNKDLYQLSMDITVEEAALPLMKRIREIPRRIINPRCGANLYETFTPGANQMTQHARLGAINFYRMSSQYFPGSFSMRYLKISPSSSLSFTICTSRTIELPFRNGSSNPAGQDCSQIISKAFSYDLTDACSGYDDVNECPALYLSVQAQPFADPTQLVGCKDSMCQTPNEAEYIVFVNNLGCGSGVNSIAIINWLLIFTVVLLAIVIEI